VADGDFDAVEQFDEQVDAVLEEPSPDLGGCEIAELAGAQHRQDVLAFDLGQGVRRGRSRCGRAESRWLATPVVGGTSPAQQLSASITLAS